MLTVFEKEKLGTHIKLGIAFWLFKNEKYTIDRRKFDTVKKAEDYLVGSIVDHVTFTLNDLVLVEIHHDNHQITELQQTLRKGLTYMIDNRKEPIKVFQCAWALRHTMKKYIYYFPELFQDALTFMVSTIKSLSYEYYTRIHQDKILDDIAIAIPQD